MALEERAELMVQWEPMGLKLSLTDRVEESGRIEQPTSHFVGFGRLMRIC